MASSFPHVSASISRALSAKRRSNKPVRRAVAEALETRLVFATSFGVEDVLLPKFIAQIGDSNNQLPASDAWWALRSQRNMAIDQPVSTVMNLGGHNAFNSLNEGFHIARGISPSQILSLSGQLDVGARLLELDVHDPFDLFTFERELILKHDIPPSSFSRIFPYDLDDALDEIADWLTKPENRNEFIYLDIQDGTSTSESGADDPLLPKLLSHLGDAIYTPEERAADGHWPSRAELLARGERVAIFTHRDDEFHGRFGVAEQFTDPNGHVWYGASLAFRANGGEDPVADRGVFHQVAVDAVTTVPSEDANIFFVTQSDGIVPLAAPRHHDHEVRRDVRLNVDFIKMDFLFGDDEDADLGSNVLPTNDPFFDLPEGNRIELLEAAVWSWAKDDPAVDRQMFRDLTPGDGTGFALFQLIEDRLSFEAANNLAEIGVAARDNGLDIAVQNTAGRWESHATTSATPLRFAGRSVAPVNEAGEYHWVLTTAGSTNWFDGPAMVQAEYGAGFVFAGPVNGFQNAQLHAGAATEPVWMNVQDLDRDGNWQVGGVRAPRITSVTVQPSTVSEAGSVDLTVAFTDDFEGHTLEIDWGDGSAATIVQLAAQDQQAVVSHVYKDDHPATGTAADSLGIKVKVTDAIGLSDNDTATVTVNNVAPVVSAFASDATFADPGAEAEPVSILASFSDVGVLDTHTALIDWGDGTTPELVTVTEAGGAGTVTGSHAYAAGGIYAVTLTLADDDTGAATIKTTAVVSGVGLSNGTLYVIGGVNADVVVFQQIGGVLGVFASMVPDKPRNFAVADVERIIAYLGAGDDVLALSPLMTIPAVVHGGAGNDNIVGGAGPAVLIGDDGDDQLTGHLGRSILVGGVGSDRLAGGKVGDVLIGGSTNLDADDDALFDAITAWNGADAYLIRATDIAGMIAASDDGDEDRLAGGQGQDLFYDGGGDILKGLRSDELLLA